MLMVIFGAGASYDSSPEFSPPQPQAIQQNFGPPPAPPNPREFWRPPLAAKLFQDPNGAYGDIVANPSYRKLLPILPRLRRPLSGSVEQELETLLGEANAEANSDSERKRQFFAVRYYLHDLLLKVSEEWLKHTSGVTNYATLLDQIRHLTPVGGAVCLVTFNYDLLLDRALLSFGFKQDDPENQSHPTFKLLKPHGSVDWARYIEADPNTRLGVEQVIQQADTIKLTDEYLRANASDPRSIHAFGRPVAPAIAVPVQTKTENFFEWPRSQSLTFEQFLPSVTKILIIGWQAQEAHFLKLLRENFPKPQPSHLMVVDMEDGASRILTRFIDQTGFRPPNLLTGRQGFTHFVVNREGEAFLRA